jgi:hypothetical protein
MNDGNGEREREGAVVTPESTSVDRGPHILYNMREIFDQRPGFY